MGILNRFGRKHAELASQWMGSAAVYGTTAGIMVIYVTDWKTVLQYLPYYNGKYNTD